MIHEYLQATVQKLKGWRITSLREAAASELISLHNLTEYSDVTALAAWQKKTTHPNPNI